MFRTVTLCVLLIFASGCTMTETSTPVDVSIVNVSETQENGTTHFSGEFAVLDRYDGEFHLEGVTADFRDSDGMSMKMIRIESVDSTDFRQAIDVRLERPPERVVITVDRVDTEADVDVRNLRRTETGFEYERES